MFEKTCIANVQRDLRDPTSTDSKVKESSDNMWRNTHLRKIGQLMLKTILGKFKSNTQDLREDSKVRYVHPHRVTLTQQNQ